jgi:uncharacterized protein (TIGR04562 family)
VEENLTNQNPGQESTLAAGAEIINIQNDISEAFLSEPLLGEQGTLIKKSNTLEDLAILDKDEILGIYQNAVIDMEETRDIAEKYSFDWDLVDVIIGGKSSIDLSKLNLNTMADAENFLKIYGYDLNKEYIPDEIQKIISEAISFIENILIPDPFTKEVNLEIPKQIKEETDARKLLLIASDHLNKMQLWACAILRVMHTISHINNDISLKFFPEIQRQILDKIWSAININSKGEKYFGDEETGIKIHDIDIKAKKERNSTILKLLHKIENVAADVFDQIGVRIITNDKVDALLVIRYLRNSGILDFCNIKPNRSINRLIDVKIFKKILNHQKERLRSGEIDKDEFERIIRQEAEREANIPYESDAVNPYTSKEYRSIQFTCRQMIRMKYPLNAPDTDERKDNFCFFFPYEMQVVDIKTHMENRFGKASHEKYKEKQLISARRRVLGKLLRNYELQSLKETMPGI